MEGKHCYNPSSCTTTGVLPVYEYNHSGILDVFIFFTYKEGTSVTGGHVYRGTGVPELTGKYVFGDYGNGKVYVLTQGTPVSVTNPFSPGA